MLFFPIWQKYDPQDGQTAVLTAFSLQHTQAEQILSSQNTVYLSALAFLSIALAFTSIFSYKNRLSQIKINFVNTFVIIGIMGLNVYLVMTKGEKLFAPQAVGAYGWAFYLPAIALIMNSLANRSIRKDELLVRSVDRLRD